MIYEVYLNDEILYYPNDEKYSICNAVLNEKIDEVSTFEFDVYPNNPKYEDIKNSVSYISIIKDNTEIFYGKVTEIEISLNKRKHIYVRGILAEMLHAYPNFTPESKTKNGYFGRIMKNIQPLGTIVNSEGKNSMTVGFNINPTSGVYYTVIKHDSSDGKYYKSRVYTSSFEINMKADFFILSISITGETGEVDCTCSKFELNNSTETGTWSALSSVPQLTSMDVLANPMDFRTFMTSQGTYGFLFVPLQKIYLGSTFSSSTGLIVVGEPGMKGSWKFEGMKDFLTELREKCVNLLDKHIKVSKKNPTNLKDHTYVVDMYSFSEYGKISNQPVEFGRNLLAFSMTESCENIINVLYPKFVRSDGTVITLYNFQDNQYHCNRSDLCIQNIESIKKYGTSALALEFKNIDEDDGSASDSDVRNELYLISKDYLIDKSAPEIIITASAVDLSGLNSSLDSFEVGDRVIVKARELGLEEDLTVPITAKTTYINDITKNVISLGTSIEAYTKQVENSLSMER